MDEVEIWSGLVSKAQNIMDVNLKTSSKRKGQFTTLIDKSKKTPFSTLKQHGNPHGVPGRPRLDADVCEFKQMCLQAI